MKDLVKYHQDGTPYSRPYLGMNKITGKPIRPYKRWPKGLTEAELLAMAEPWLEQQSNAAKLGVSGKLVELLHSYVDTLSAAGSPVNTVRTYRSCITALMEPNVGGTRADDFTPLVAQSLYNVLLMRESRKGGIISPNTVLKLHWFLCGAFKYFMAEGLASHNPMPSVIHPQERHVGAVAYSEDEFTILSAFLDDVMSRPADTPDTVFLRMAAAASYTSLWNGTRCGETLALRRSDIQVGRGNMHVCGTIVADYGGLKRQGFNKNHKTRNVSIYDDCLSVLSDHAMWQRSLFADDPDGVPSALFTSMNGDFLRPSEVTRAFSCRIRDALNLPNSTHFHTLRHTHATYMILGGANIVEVCERLGHANEAFTLRLYGHLLPGRDQAAIEAFAQFSAKAKKGRRML